MTTLNIKGQNKAAVLAALYNASQPLGMGLLHFTPQAMTTAEAAKVIADLGEFSKQNGRIDFDYLNGRVMKVDIGGDELFTGLYDRDNGPGAAERALRAAGLLSDEPVTCATITEQPATPMHPTSDP
jgi:hypothetical protein